MAVVQDEASKSTVPVSDLADTFRAQWKAERPGLESDALFVWGRLKRGAELLDRQFEVLLTQFDMTVGMFETLAALCRSGPPYELRPTELTKWLVVTPATVTNRLAQLEQRGYIERHRIDGDRRALSIVLTSLGRERFDEAFDALLVRVEELVTASGVDQVALANLMRTLLVHLEGLGRPT